MDPICHTLVGACLAQTGLKRRSRFGMATLLVAANVPDVDVIAGFMGRSLELRRGVTHGVAALPLWPLVVGGIVWAIGRWRGDPSRPVRFRALVGLAALGVLTHPALDYLNTYGMRWLMPFEDRWFYGDTLFIVDPWLWLALGLGVFLVSRRERAGMADAGRPARIALALALGYIGAMMMTTLVARDEVARTVGPDGRAMVAPRPATPLDKDVVAVRGDWYLVGRYRFGSGGGLALTDSVAIDLSPELLRAIRGAAGGRAFLHWARFPVGSISRTADSVRYEVYDLRYASGPGGGWAFTVVEPIDR